MEAEQKRRIILGIAVLIGIVVAGIAAEMFVFREDGPSKAVNEHGWSGATGNCFKGPFGAGPGRRPVPGRVQGIGTGKEAESALSGCALQEGLNSEGEWIADEDATYFVVSTGSDRLDTRLVGVEPGDPVTLTIEHDIPGARCGVTADYKGDLILVLRAPKDASVPRVVMRQVSMPC
ncbi:MAG: hypothetical protein KDB26_02960 [Microthrixaceae bacterium]|nr:hypothetical protein [Microthrixaceae bacterium]